MKRSQVGNRPYVRKRRTLGTTGERPLGPTGRLADRAGMAARPNVEQLEPRQLLFSMTITEDSVDATGIGTVSATFGYVIPYLIPGTPPGQAQPDTIVLEDFNGEDFTNGVLPTNVINGRIFGESNLVANHNINPPSDFQLVKELDGQEGNDAAKLKARMQIGEQFSFRVSDLDGVNTGPFVGLRNMEMDITAVTGGNVGLNLANTRVVLFFAGQEVASFTGAQLGALNTTNPGTGVGHFVFAAPGPNAALFDQIRFESIAGDNNEAFYVDNVQFAEPDVTVSTGLIVPLIFGARVSFSGPVGASAQFLDLYGHEIVATTALGVPDGGTVALVDRNVDLHPDFNAGIGKIIITGSNFSTALTMIGGTIDSDFVFTLPTAWAGTYDDFEGAGFGYDLTTANPPRAMGLPPGPGSVIIGAPWLRPETGGNPTGRAAPIAAYNFNRADQGIFVQGGANIGLVNIHGIVHGSSRFTGAVDQISMGTLVGSVTVAGDLGSLVVGSEAGIWAADVAGQGRGQGVMNSTGSQLIVGRTLGEVAIAGRSLLNVTVVGDLNDRVNHPPRDTYRYFEKEYVYRIDPSVQNPIEVLYGTHVSSSPGHNLDILNSATGDVDGAGFRRSATASAFGGGTYRNDSFTSAEWIGNVATAAQVFGNVGYIDPVNAEDQADAYSFAVDGSQPIVLTAELTGPGGILRILDSSGRTVAAGDFTDLSVNREAQLRYDPVEPGVYTVVIAGPADGAAGSGFDYLLTISGMASTTFGSYRTGANSGSFGAAQYQNFINVLSGSIGSLRIGTGYWGGGGEADPSETFNPEPTGTNFTIDDMMAWNGGSFTAPGNLYQILTGGDIGGRASTATPSVNIGGDLGIMLTGQSTLLGVAPEQGDLDALNLSVGGRIAMLDIRGAVGIDQDSDPDSFAAPDSVQIKTGVKTGRGDIGMIRVGAHVRADTMRITATPGAIIGGFLVSQDISYDPTSPLIGIYGNLFVQKGVSITTGAGADVRFVDFPRLDTENAFNAGDTLDGGAVVELTDDGGATISIQIVGGTGGGFVRSLAIDNSQGKAIASIDADLTGGGQLRISGKAGINGSKGVISIGKINITGGDGNSVILIDSKEVEIDVYQIVQSGGDLGRISNNSPGGDIVVIDTAGNLGRINITGAGGSLGRTQVPLWGPRLLGPFLGVGVGGGRTIPVPGAGPLMDDDFNGQLYRPITSGTRDPAQAFMDDIGGPANPYLNGAIIRTGDVLEVTVAGAIGDVVVAVGDIIALTANSDNITAEGGFDGIVGVIYANDIRAINIGDGLASPTHSPIPTVGIFANDDIFGVTGTQAGAFIAGIISAGNVNTEDRGGVLDGIESISLKGGGDFRDAYISVSQLDAFWFGSGYDTDGILVNGDLNSLQGTNADFFRSEILCANLPVFTLTGGFYDASRVNATGNVGTMTAVAFRNSTLTGTDLEFHTSEILIGGNANVIQTFGSAGNIDDQRIDILGSITQKLTALNFNRTQVEVDGTIFLLDVKANFRAGIIDTGRLDDLTVVGNLVSSRVSVSGILTLIEAENIINSQIEVTGPGGRIDEITANGLFSGSVSASGPIGTLESLTGDVRLHITTTGSLGNVTLLRAARDLDITTDISGGLSQLVAGRHLGNKDSRGVILVRGDLASASISGAQTPQNPPPQGGTVYTNGQLYADLRIGGALTGAITIGRANTKPGSTELGHGSIVGFGRLNSIVVNGDFAGSIINYSGGIASVTINNGSFYRGGLIAAYNGDLSNLIINSGHLFGDVHADFVIGQIVLNASEDGVFGDVGINPTLSAAVAADEFRNQLPLGSTITSEVQGPSITAGREIAQISLTNGSIFEATIWAGRSIGNIYVNGNISNDTATTGAGTVIAAADLVYSVLVTGSISDANILGGVLSFGADGRAGGTGDAADTIKAGRVRLVHIDGDATNLAIAAGMTAGTDGTYNSAGAMHALGLSYVQTVEIGGEITNVSAFADSGLTSAPAAVVIGGRTSPVVGGVLNPVSVPRDGNGVPIWSDLGTVLTAGVAFDFGAGTITYTGPGVVVWNADSNQLMLLNTTLATNVTVTSTEGTLTDFDIVSNDDAMAGVIEIQANLDGDSDITIDGYVTSIIAGNFSGTGAITVGNDLQLLQLGSFSGGSVSAIFVRQIAIAGSDSGTITIYGSEGVSIGGDFSGVVSLDRGLRGNFVVGGAMTLGALRSGAGIDGIQAGLISRSVISARDFITTVTVAGSVTDSSIMGGVDLGRDARYGGTGLDADSVGNGSVGTVSVGGNFGESDVVAGALRGADGFYGTSDDVIADGRSTIGGVAIGGTVVGSNFGSESYRVFATGSIGPVTLAGKSVTKQGNFEVVRDPTQPQAIQVVDLQVTQDSGVYTASIFFNQAMDASTIGPALGVFEVRGDSGEVTIKLIEGLDYSVSYEPGESVARIVFATAVTRRNLPQQPGQPGPGIYRFTLDADLLRAAVTGARLDGNGDGLVTGDDYSADDIVGDAGDKVTQEQVVLTNPDTGETTTVDVYAPVNLNIVLDNNEAPDGLADANKEFTIRGTIGDHPDNDTDNFRYGSDVDVYKVTLQAGQILRLGASSGAVLLNSFTNNNSVLYNAAGQALGAPTSDAALLPSQGDADLLATTFGSTYLVRATGDYYLVISGPQSANAFYNQPGALPNSVGEAGEVGSYEFTFKIFDDGNTGFNGSTDSGDGENVPTPPVAGDFGEGVTSIVSGSYTYTLDAQQNVVTTIYSAIGDPGYAGVPGVVMPDIDVYHLNDGQTIEPGARTRITVRLTDLGSDLGSRIDGRNGGGTAFPVRYSGQVQFGVFDTTLATGLDDGVMLFSPTDFLPTGGTPGTIASDGATTYGYDANGDFFVEFVAPGTKNGETIDPAKYAVYIQGVFNTDYQLEIVTLGSADIPAPTHQNVFIETRGGTIDWLQASGISTDLTEFDTRLLGFTGTINGQSTDTYVIARLVASLNAVFAASGLDVTFSANPADFEFQDFSTVFVSSLVDPINFFNSDIFGYSEHSDAFNADHTDQGVVFVQPMASLGYTPSNADIDQFSDSLTAAVGRRVGELLGLRIAEPEVAGGAIVDIMGADSVSNTPNGGIYQFSTLDRALSGRFDSINGTDFYLGRQNAVSLLDRLLGQ